MVVNGNADVGVGHKEISNKWPVVEGLEQDDKHEGRVQNLVAVKSLVSSRYEVGL